MMGEGVRSQPARADASICSRRPGKSGVTMLEGRRPRRPHRMSRSSSLHAVLGIVLAGQVLYADWPVPPQRGQELPPASFEVKKASLEDLFFHAQLYATTPQKRADKHAARDAFFKRGPEAFNYLMENIHVENLWIRVMALELVRKIPAEKALPVLLTHLEEGSEKHKKYALFFLGFFDPPEDPPDLTPYLREEELEGGAIRTLGKWKTTEAVPVLLPFLQHEKERIRIMAANALRDIGDSSAVPALTAAAKDEFFTVRKCAERALEKIQAKRGG